MSSDAWLLRNWVREKVSIRIAILTTVGLLLAVGLLAVLASSSVGATQRYGDPTFFFKKQLFITLVGFSLVFVIGHLPLRHLDRLPLVMYLVAACLLVATLIPGIGHEVKGATRWIRLPGFGFQPGELAKIATILLLAKNLSRPGSSLVDLRHGVTSSMAVVITICFLLLLQPDFGTAALIFAVAFSMLVCRGLGRHFILLLLGTGVAAVTMLVYFSPYRLKRILIFLDPWKDPAGGGFQIIQSLVGFKAGGLFGLGIGESRQKLFFLPDAHNDFILAVIAEELGLVGVLLILVLFGYLAYLGLRVYALQRDPYRRFAALGITFLISYQALINIGVALAVLPPKGIPLPFVSNGASSLLCFLFAVGLLTRYSQTDSGH